MEAVNNEKQFSESISQNVMIVSCVLTFGIFIAISVYKTIDKLLDYFVPPMEVGINVEKEEWIQFELRNFKGTVEMLIKKHGVYTDQIAVEYL